MEGANPTSWQRQIRWTNPYNLDSVEQSVQLTKTSLWGLAISGASEAVDTLKAALAPTSEMIAAANLAPAQATSLSALAEEALNYHTRVAKEGLR